MYQYNINLFAFRLNIQVNKMAAFPTSEPERTEVKVI